MACRKLGIFCVEKIYYNDELMAKDLHFNIKPEQDSNISTVREALKLTVKARC